MILIVAGFFLLLTTLLVIPCIRLKIIELIKKIIRNLKFKTPIMFITTVFLDFSFSLITQILVFKNQNWKILNSSKIGVIFTWIIFSGFLVGFIILSYKILEKNKKNLANKEFKETYGAMTRGLKPKNQMSIYIYPVFMMKRLTHILIVLIFYNMPGLQILSLINLQFIYLIFIIKTKSSREYRQFILDIFNESCLFLMFYHLYIFGDSGIVNGTDNQIIIDARI